MAFGRDISGRYVERNLVGSRQAGRPDWTIVDSEELQEEFCINL
jgi:hypothetical protein